MGAKTTFRKRHYHSVRQLWSDVNYLLSRRTLIKQAMGKEMISVAFRERLMNVVTEVNDCRYCRSFHHQQALASGIDPQELRALRDGMVPEQAPEDEIPALLYARHWAEADGVVDEEDRQVLLARYREPMVEALHVILMMIRTGNLLGNTFDYWLYRISGGSWGNPGK